MGGEGVGCGRRQGDTHVPGAPLQGLPSARAPAVPLAPAPPGCGGFAPALRPPGSGVRFFVPAHARPILTDRVRGLPVANRCARPAFPAPWGPRSTAPLSAHVVQACAAGRLFGVQHLGRLALPSRVPGAGLCAFSPLVARRCQRSDRCWASRGPGGALPFTSEAEPVVASGREMVVVSVPAEVTVILLDIEGTTTPIAFVKVRGGRERRSYLCLKTSEKEI